MQDLVDALAKYDAKLERFVRTKQVGTEQYNRANKMRARYICILAGESERGQDDEVKRMHELLLEGRVAARRAAKDFARVVRLIEQEEVENQKRAQRILFWTELAAAFLAGFFGVRRL